MELFRDVKPTPLSNLNLNFKPISEVGTEIIETMVEWGKDPDIQELIFPRRSESAEYVTWTKDSLLKKFNSEYSETSFLIFDGDAPIGEMNYRMDFPLLLKDQDQTAWIGITIAEKKYWRQGIGSQALEHLEKQVFLKGAKRIELGVFEFNTAAIRFYERQGYGKIGSIPRFVYYRDKMWSDVRMEKLLCA
jgi:RimJ/RimL family protein N-acetyltransferase